MAKLIIFIILFSGCATSEKNTGVPFSIEMRNNLFKTQNTYENLKSFDDALFKGLTGPKCLFEWQTEVAILKKKVKQFKKATDRVTGWFELGQCYNLVKDYRLSIYYYDLVLAQENISGKNKAIINYNTGKMYQEKGLQVLANSYFKQSIKFDSTAVLPHYSLILNLINQGEYKTALKSIRTLLRISPNSDLVRFLEGLSYFYLSDQKSLSFKVLPKLNDKSIEKILLSLALRISSNSGKKEAREELESMEFSFGLYRDFKLELLERFGDEKT